TANNIAEICGEVHLISILGKENSFEDFILNNLQPNIKPKFFYREDAPTTIKRRFIQENSKQKLAQICYMNDTPIPKDLENEIIDHLEHIIPEYDLVVISDFGHGLFSSGLVDFICNNAKYLALNVQTNSANTGFNLVTKYWQANYVSIDEPEIRLAAHDKHGDLREIMEEMFNEIKFENLMVTRGSQGSLNYDRQTGFHETPAFASVVVDSIGAGDALFAYTSPCMSIGLPRDLTAFVGNAVGSLAVQIVCNRTPVSVVDLIKYITRLLK
ncbi:cytidyltransferase, partial [bacterium]|nr:cytidyltransferase [bacterium]